MPFFNLHNALRRPQEVTELYLNRSMLGYLPETVRQCSNLRLLDLSSNQLTGLPDIFDAFPQLEELDLSSNQLTHLPPTISALANLKVLKLDDNQLRGQELSRLLPGNLKTLTLSHNPLGKIALDQPFPKLETLEMRKTKLKTAADWKAMPALRKLDLSGNRLQELPSNFRLLRQLERLYLDQNKLTTLPDWLRELPELQELRSNKNKLAKLSEAIVRCSKLRYLQLSGNQLQALPRSFYYLTNLRELDLSHNQLARLPKPIPEMQDLDKLNLSGNQLQALPDLSQLRSLRVLDLSKNTITRLPVLPPNLKNLFLNGNPITSLQALRGTPNLQLLEVKGHALPAFPPEILELGRLQHLLGLRPYRQTQRILKLIATAPFKRLPVDLRLRIARYWVDEEKDALEELSPTALLQFMQLDLKELYDPLLQLLQRHTATLNRSIPESTTTIRILGDLSKASRKLPQQLQQAGISVEDQAEDILLGKTGFNDGIHIPGSARFWTEAQAHQWLQQKKGKVLEPALNPLQIKRLQQRLLQSRAASVRPALMLLQGGGVPQALLPALLLAWKIREPDPIREALKKLLDQYLPPAFHGLYRKRLEWDASWNKEQKLQAITRWVEGTELSKEGFEELFN